MVSSAGISASPGAAPAASSAGLSAAASAYAAYEETESTLAAHYSSVAQELEASGVPSRLIHLPSTEPAGLVNGAVVPGPLYAQELAAVSQGYTASPAPAGIAYYGEAGADSGASETTTVLDTSSLAGTLNVTNMSSLYLDTDNPDQWGVQLNAVATNVTLWGSRGTGAEGYAYWMQNVIGYQSYNQTLQFDENTWNFTSTAESFPASGTIVAHDNNDTLEDGEVYVGESQYFYAPEPFNLTLYANLSLYNNLICNKYSSLNGTSTCDSTAAARAGYQGDQTLFYNYSLSFPVTNTKVAPGTHYSGSFDWLTFHTAKTGVEDNGANVRSAGFEASGSKDEVIGLTDDFELDFGIGAYDGANQNIFGGSGTASLSYVPDCTSYVSGQESTCTIPSHPTYKSVPAALNFGSQTGEDAVGIDVNYASGADRALFSAGPLNLHPLWGYASAPGVTAGQIAVTNGVTVSGSPLTLSAQPYIFVFLEDTSVTHPADGYAWAPDVGTWYLMPGAYNYEALLSDYTEQTGSFTVSTSPVTVTATLPYATSNGVYTPLWAVAGYGTSANARIAGISSSGAGTITSPYVLFNNNDTATSQAVNSLFTTSDDYKFPSFAGLLFWNTTAYVEESHGVEYFGSTTVGYLQQQLYKTQHVIITHTHNILSWAEMTSLFETTASQNPVPQGSLMVWNSTNDLIAGNTFVGEKARTSSYVATTELVLYGGGSECDQPYSVAPGAVVHDPCGGNAGPAPSGSKNVIWGNTFCDAACTTSPSAPGTYAGIGEAEDGNLVYNNNFKVDNPAPLMPWGLVTELGPVFYYDTWNVSEQAASHVVQTVNGVALSGNILDTGVSTTYTLQGGNSWWNYGNSLNPLASAPYYNDFDYTDGAATIFPPPYTSNDENGLLGAGDASPLGGFAVTFSETGLPGGTAWYVNLTLPGQALYPVSSTGTSATPVYLSDGSYAFRAATANKEYQLTSTPSPVVVAGAAKAVTLAFSQYTSGVTFDESGLPAGTQWWVNITGQSTLTGTGTMLSVNEPNGSYTYTASSTAKNYSVAGGSFMVSGPMVVDVAFTLLTAAPSATPNPVEVGVATEIAANAGGGSGTYVTYAWSGLPTGCADPGSVASFSCSPSSAGDTSVQVLVTDSNGAVASGSVELVVSASLTVSASASVNPVDEGQATTVSAVAGGGVGEDTFVWSGLPGGCGTPGNVSSFVCTPAAGDASGSPYTVQVSVTDGDGGMASYAFALTVDSALTAAPSASMNPLDVGQATTVSANAAGGAAPYSYAWSGLAGSGCAGSGASFVCAPTTAGTYTVWVNVTDGNGFSVHVSFVLDVDSAVSAGTVGGTPNPVTVGTSTTISTTGATGGSGGYSYAWSGYPATCTPGDVASFSCTPTTVGTYTVELQVTDSNGETASASFELMVNPVGTFAVTFTESGLPSGTEWYVNITGGPSLSGTTTMLSTDLPNGGYTYTVASANKEFGGHGGGFPVAGSAVGVSVSFAKETFTVTYTETGIPAKKLAKVGWSVELNGTEKSAKGATISFSGLTNGSYPLLIQGPTGFTSSVASGSQTVKGTTGVTVTFTKGRTAVLSFHEKGLPKGSTWCVAVDGENECSSTGVVKFTALTPGSYAFAVTSPATGYTVTEKVGKVAVTSPVSVTKGTAVKVTFVATGGPGGKTAGPLSGVSRLSGAGAVTASWGLVGAAVAVASALALVGAGVLTSRRGGRPGVGSEE